jgi:3-dehydroquinate synthetase
MEKAIFNEWLNENPKKHFTIGIADHFKHMLKAYDANFKKNLKAYLKKCFFTLEQMESLITIKMSSKSNIIN